MTLAYMVLIVGNIAASLGIWLTLDRERNRNRILRAFIAGLVRSVSDYVSATDEIDPDEMPERYAKLPIPYKGVLEAVEHELLKNISIWKPKKYIRWLQKNRRLFIEEPFRKDGRDDGFVFMNYDLFDDLAARWRSDELMTQKERAYLSEEIVVTKDNVGELQGEIAMYKDLLAGRVHGQSFGRDTIDDRLAIMFSHLKQEYRDKLKRKILCEI